ncbi:hypothetical protein SO802_021656 [Lithocarpus litseifolius]|uniref:Lipase-like PAD4 n=1 Tax=Lithocarpus litseifolius TaxID=425828 RepID=A0AAW2CIX0_9ROSI
METETSSFEMSEMLATFLASTPLLSESWRLCNISNTSTPRGFLAEQIGDVGYVAFSGIQTVGNSEPSCRNLVPLMESDGNALFIPLHRLSEGEEPVMVHAGLLQLFLSMHKSTSLQSQMLALMKKSKPIVITGHSLGGTVATLCTLWLLSYLQSVSSPLQVLCITFGSPMLGNESLSKAVLGERWGGNFCNVVSKHDIMPRMLFAPQPSFTQLQFLLQYWHLSMNSPRFGMLAQLHDEDKAELFRLVLCHLEVIAQAGEEVAKSLFWPLGSYLFCSEEGAICVDNAVSVIKMMYLLLMTGSPCSSVEDHLKYGDYVEKVSLQFLNQSSFMQADIPESSYESGVAMALQSLGIYSQETVARPVKDCLKTARRMGLRPNLNAAKLAVSLAKINPYRAQIEWYKASCDESDDHMGYYDCFKLRDNSKKGSKVNLNRHKLAAFWNNVIKMLDNNELPYDFNRRAKWVNTSQFYKLLVEPLDIAEYYRTGMHLVKGHYLKHGRERRYEIFDRWWRERKVSVDENNKRSKLASLTQDSCFWARVEEAREWLDNIRSESDPKKLAFLWENIDAFEKYARKLVDNMEVSRDVLLNNSSYKLWVEEWGKLKSQLKNSLLSFQIM